MSSDDITKLCANMSLREKEGPNPNGRNALGQEPQQDDPSQPKTTGSVDEKVPKRIKVARSGQLKLEKEKAKKGKEITFESNAGGSELMMHESRDLESFLVINIPEKVEKTVDAGKFKF
ncbi:hypothetical protein Q3G72_020906 [Acer saccharum]|nr:hypothetical protein Q3G72_020906 [Acer saccharum]